MFLPPLTPSHTPNHHFNNMSQIRAKTTLPVDEVQTIQRVTELAIRMESTKEAAFVGYMMLHVIDPDGALNRGTKLIFGRYNNRPLEAAQVNHHYQSLISNGIQTKTGENAIRIGIRLSQMSEDSVSDHANDSTPNFHFSDGADTHEIVAFGGQH